MYPAFGLLVCVRMHLCPCGNVQMHQYIYVSHTVENMVLTEAKEIGLWCQ